MYIDPMKEKNMNLTPARIAHNAMLVARRLEIKHGKHDYRVNAAWDCVRIAQNFAK